MHPRNVIGVEQAIPSQAGNQASASPANAGGKAWYACRRTQRFAFSWVVCVVTCVGECRNGASITRGRASQPYSVQGYLTLKYSSLTDSSLEPLSSSAMSHSLCARRDSSELRFKGVPQQFNREILF